MPHPGQNLDVRVALIRDLCRQVPTEQQAEDEDGARRWDEKADGTHENWPKRIRDAGLPKKMPSETVRRFGARLDTCQRQERLRARPLGQHLTRRGNSERDNSMVVKRSR